jgi:hypothetical protein
MTLIYPDTNIWSSIRSSKSLPWNSSYFTLEIPLIYLLQIFRSPHNLYVVREHVKGDKIRIKCGQFIGERGILMRQHSGKWIVSLAHRGRTILVSTEDLTNYSLAARRAWRSMPDRKVGRPTGSKVSDRLSVIFRVDRTVWNEFVGAEKIGLVGDRTTVINECLRNILASSRRARPKAS